MKQDLRPYLTPTEILDSDHPRILGYAKETVGESVNPIDRAVKLFLAVRDNILYDPYSPFYRSEHYQASNVLKWGRGFCIQKASLLCTLGRASGIPSRIGFATVRNHLATRQLLDVIGSNLFVYHGFVEFYLEGKWVKATPTFNSDLCKLHKVKPLEFNGREDALFHAYNSENKKFMEYLEYHGTYADISVPDIVAAWEKAYGKDRVKYWMKMYDERWGISLADFYSEDVMQG